MDRLPLLRSIAGISPDTVKEYSIADASDEKGNACARVNFAVPLSEIDQETVDSLALYFKDVQFVQDNVEEIRRMVSQVQEKHTENMQSVDEARSQVLRGEIDQLSTSITSMAKASKDKLDEMSKNTLKLKETPESVQANSAIIRISDNQYAYFVTKLTTVMAEYQRQQAANEAFYKAQTKRQIKIKYTNQDGTAISDVQAESLAEQVLQNNMSSYIFQQSKDVLASIIETRNDIYRIEQSMRDLNQLFNDLAFLVNEQGELLDVILANVQQTTRYVEAGRKELKKARKYQKKSRKKLICIVVCALVIVAAFVIAILLGSFVKK